MILEQQLISRQTDAQLRGVAAYPFSRALRFEVQGGGRRLWFDRELTTYTYASKFAGGSRSLVSSYGAAVRVNALGYAVLEFSLARPQDRPGKGWMFGFNLIPGF